MHTRKCCESSWGNKVLGVRAEEGKRKTREILENFDNVGRHSDLLNSCSDHACRSRAAQATQPQTVLTMGRDDPPLAQNAAPLPSKMPLPCNVKRVQSVNWIQWALAPEDFHALGLLGATTSPSTCMRCPKKPTWWSDLLWTKETHTNFQTASWFFEADLCLFEAGSLEPSFDRSKCAKWMLMI